jgi:octaprenyl-diphosphate synthase
MASAKTMQTSEAQRAADAGISPVERLHSLVATDMAATEKMIHERMGSAVELIPTLAKHLVDSGGKRLRPMLTLAAAKMGGYRGQAHISLAAAVEFIHSATLLHDDVVDASTLRRGKVVANMVWGNKPSVLVGDFLFSRSFQLMVAADDIQVLAILSNASAVIAEGEVMQMRSSNNLATTEGDYLTVIKAKTAELFAAAAESGAKITGKGPSYTAAMRHYGQSLGIAFQLVDDALDYSGKQSLMGKSVGDDFREAKVTLPVILAYANAESQAKQFWKRVIEEGTQSEADLERAISYVEGTGSIRETMARARHYAAEARNALADLPLSDIRSALADIADFCVDRAY